MSLFSLCLLSSRGSDLSLFPILFPVTLRVVHQLNVYLQSFFSRGTAGDEGTQDEGRQSREQHRKEEKVIGVNVRGEGERDEVRRSRKKSRKTRIRESGVGKRRKARTENKDVGGGKGKREQEGNRRIKKWRARKDME